MKLNKKSFIELLEKETNLNYDECKIINELLESYLIIGKKNRLKRDLKEKLNKSDSEIDKIYDEISEIITNNIKEKIKHPLKK